MSVKIYKRAISYLLLMEGCLLLFIPFTDKAPDILNTNLPGQNYQAKRVYLNTVIFLKSHAFGLQNQKVRPQYIVKADAACLNLNITCLSNSFYGRLITAKALKNFILFPYHSFW